MNCMLNFHIYNVIQNVIFQRKSKAKFLLFIMEKFIIRILSKITIFQLYTEFFMRD